MIYLDTHVLVMLFQDVRLIGKQSRRALQRDVAILISPIVTLELQFLYEIGRIRYTPKTILHAMEKELGVQLCARGFADVIAAAQEMTWTRDPFDRIIVAQASLQGNKLVTKDATIQKHYRPAIW
jgi:PIN domain nuclease of toxin-antitoxin system